MELIEIIHPSIYNHPVLLITDEGTEYHTWKELIDIRKNTELDIVLLQKGVVKMMDYNKFLYNRNKNKKSSKPKPLKTIQFTPNTDDHDYNFKKNQIIEFLKNNHKVKALVFFKGRQITFKDQGEILLLKIANEIEEVGKIENLPKLEGRRMIMMINPKTK